MNRRHFFASLAGAPFVLAAPQYARGGSVGELGPEAFYGAFPQPNFTISGSKSDAAEIARVVGRAIPDAIARYHRQPMRR